MCINILVSSSKKDTLTTYYYTCSQKKIPWKSVGILHWHYIQCRFNAFVTIGQNNELFKSLTQQLHECPELLATQWWCWVNGVWIVGQRLRRWPTIQTTLSGRLSLADQCAGHTHTLHASVVKASKTNAALSEVLWIINRILL